MSDVGTGVTDEMSTEPTAWITIAISVISIVAGAVSALVARAFKSGKKEASFESQGSLFNNMLTNSVKDQVALKEEVGRICKTITSIDIRLTRIETIMTERDKFQRQNDKGYGAFRDRQETDNNRNEWR